jgi:hypothetical protein
MSRSRAFSPASISVAVRVRDIISLTWVFSDGPVGIADRGAGRHFGGDEIRLSATRLPIA